MTEKEALVKFKELEELFLKRQPPKVLSEDPCFNCKFHSIECHRGKCAFFK